jgi:hypothetical protein
VLLHRIIEQGQYDELVCLNCAACYEYAPKLNYRVTLRAYNNRGGKLVFPPICRPAEGRNLYLYIVRRPLIAAKAVWCTFSRKVPRNRLRHLLPLALCCDCTQNNAFRDPWF